VRVHLDGTRARLELVDARCDALHLFGHARSLLGVGLHLAEHRRHGFERRAQVLVVVLALLGQCRQGLLLQLSVYASAMRKGEFDKRERDRELF